MLSDTLRQSIIQAVRPHAYIVFAPRTLPGHGDRHTHEGPDHQCGKTYQNHEEYACGHTIHEKFAAG